MNQIESRESAAALAPMAMTSTSPRTTMLALAVLRISLGVFLLVWSAEKFVIRKRRWGYGRASTSPTSV